MPDAVKKAFDDFTTRNQLTRLIVKADDSIFCAGWSPLLNVEIAADYDRNGFLVWEY